MCEKHCGNDFLFSEFSCSISPFDSKSKYSCILLLFSSSHECNLIPSLWGQGEDTEEAVSITKPRTKTSTTAPEEASLTQKTPAKKKPTVLILLYLTISVLYFITSIQMFIRFLVQKCDEKKILCISMINSIRSFSNYNFCKFCVRRDQKQHSLK